MSERGDALIPPEMPGGWGFHEDENGWEMLFPDGNVYWLWATWNSTREDQAIAEIRLTVQALDSLATYLQNRRTRDREQR